MAGPCSGMAPPPVNSRPPWQTDRPEPAAVSRVRRSVLVLAVVAAAGGRGCRRGGGRVHPSACPPVRRHGPAAATVVAVYMGGMAVGATVGGACRSLCRACRLALRGHRGPRSGPCDCVPGSDGTGRGGARHAGPVFRCWDARSVRRFLSGRPVARGAPALAGNEAALRVSRCECSRAAVGAAPGCTERRPWDIGARCWWPRVSWFSPDCSDCGWRGGSCRGGRPGVRPPGVPREQRSPTRWWAAREMGAEMVDPLNRPAPTPAHCAFRSSSPVSCLESGLGRGLSLAFDGSGSALRWRSQRR